MRSISLLAFCLAATTACAVDLSKAIPGNTSQLVLVESRDWSAATGTLRRFERTNAHAPWQPLGTPVDALLGRNGMAWGAGLSSLTKENGPHKKEGDLRAPAGVFELGNAFGRAVREEMPWLRMPYVRLTPTTEAIDDPASQYYNRIVDRARVTKPDWKSSEHMWTISVYELGLVIAHNPRRTPGAGSCIFLHLWLDGSDGTAGCTALHRTDLVELLRWLDGAKHPVLVQLPADIARESLSGF